MMRHKMPFHFLVLCLVCTGCSQTALTDPPDVEYQDVSLSLSTVNTDEYLHQFEYDPSLPLKIEEVDSWRSRGVTVTEIAFDSPRGGRVPALIFVPDGAGPFAGLVLMHGDPGSKLDFKDRGVSYARRGFVAIAIDAPHIRPEHYILTPYMAGSWPRYNEMDIEEQSQLVVDLQRAVDVLLTRPDVDPDRLAFIGGSFGGAMGGLFAGIEKRLKAYVLVVGDGGMLEHLGDPLEDGTPFHWHDRWAKILWPYEPIHYVGLTSPAALLFQNGVTDNYVPPRDALRYQQAGSEPKTILWYQAGHFLPWRHSYDHLNWLHTYVGAGTLLWKPSFRASSWLYEALFIAWIVLSLASLAWILRRLWRSEALTWGKGLFWLANGLFFGPLSAGTFMVLERSQASSEKRGQALHRALGVAVCTALSYAVVLQVRFLTVIETLTIFHWMLLLPPLVCCIALPLLRRIEPSEGKPSLAVDLAQTLGLAALLTALSFIVLESAMLGVLDYAMPVYAPMQWSFLVLAGVLAAGVSYPLHLWMVKSKKWRWLWAGLSVPIGYGTLVAAQVAVVIAFSTVKYPPLVILGWLLGLY